MIGGDGGSDSEDSLDSDDDSEESEDEDDTEEKTGLLSKIADGVQHVVSQLDQITTEVHPFYTEKIKEIKAEAFTEKIKEIKAEAKGRARKLDTESVVTQVLHKALADLTGTPITFVWQYKSRPESGCISHQR